MTAPTRTVVLEGLPERLATAALTYLADTRRECQLVLADDEPGATSPQLRELAASLVPDLEEVRDLFTRADCGAEGGTLRYAFPMHAGHAGVMAHLQMQLVQLRLLGRQGELLVPSDPLVTHVLTWMWDEAMDQLHGRAPRPYRLREV